MTPRQPDGTAGSDAPPASSSREHRTLARGVREGVCRRSRRRTARGRALAVAGAAGLLACGSPAAEPDSGAPSPPDRVADAAPLDLDPGAAPGENFDLGQWKITFPDASERDVDWLTSGNTRDGEFYTDPDTGGMVFRCPNRGATTSDATNYSRTELREMLRGTDTGIPTKGINGNNWVTGTSSAAHRAAAGGVDGTLRATLSVDRVSTTNSPGDDFMVGRVIVGQIHGPDDEPCRLYYRKLPGNTRGSVYFATEPEDGDDIFVPLIGSRSDAAADPVDGIALGERWSYEITTRGRELTVTVTRADGSQVSASHEISAHHDDAYLYFKAGVYNQNNGGEPGDHVQATFYELAQRHD